MAGNWTEQTRKKLYGKKLTRKEEEELEKAWHDRQREHGPVAPRGHISWYQPARKKTRQEIKDEKKRFERDDVLTILAKKRKGGVPLGDRAHPSGKRGFEREQDKELAQIEYDLMTGKGLRAPKGKGSRTKEMVEPLPRKYKKAGPRRKKKKKPIIVEFAEVREKRNGRK